MVQWQTIPIDLFAGVDTKTEDKRVLPGKLLTSENSRLAESGIVKKRKGYAALSKAAVNAQGNIASGAFAATMDGSLTVGCKEPVNSIQQLAYWSEAESKWIAKFLDTQMHPVSIETIGVSNSHSDINNCDVAEMGGIVMSVYFRSDGNDVLASAFDATSKSFYFRDQGIGNGATNPKSRPRIAATDSNFFVVYSEPSNNKIYLRKYSATDVGSVSAPTETTKVTDLHGDDLFDICEVDSTKVLLVYKDTSGDIQLIQMHDSAGDDTDSLAPTNKPINVLTCAAASNGGTDYFVVAYEETAGTGGVFWYLLERSPFVTVSLGPIQASNLDDLDQLSITQFGSNINFQFEYDGVSNPEVISVRSDFTGSASSGSSEQFNKLITKTFTFDGRAYYFEMLDGQTDKYANMGGRSTIVPLIYGPTLFRNRISVNRSTATLSSVTADSNGDFYLSMIVDDRLSSDGVVISHVEVVKIDVTSVLPSYVNTPGASYIGAGELRVVEKNTQHFSAILHAPEITATAQSASGGSMSDGTYQYVIVAEWTSPRGEIYRSAVSNESSITVNGGGSSQKVTLTFKYIDTSVIAPDPDYYVYRTVDAGTIFYKTGAAVTNISGFPTQTVDDTAADATILSNEILYTNGNVLGNDPTHSTNIVAYGEGRIFYVPFDNTRRVYFSKRKEKGLPFEFNDTLFVESVDQEDIKALGFLDTNLILYSENDISFLFGDGPNKLGVGSFPPPRKLATDAGCISHNSLVSTHVGHFFKSNKGIYLLDRSMQTHYIGADVEEFNSDTVLRALLHEAENQVLFLLDNDKVLVYQYNIDKQAPAAGFWSVWTGHTNMVDGTIYSNNFVWVDSAAQVYEQDNSFTDGSTSYSLKLITSWIALAGLAGFQRIRRLSFLGDMPTDHTLTIKVYYDFDDTLKQTLTIDTSADITGNVLEFRRRLNKQKCEAIKFEISDSSGSGTEENYRVNQLALEVGVKRGINRIQTAG